MRSTWALLVAAILAAFAAGYLALWARTSPLPEPSLAQIASARQDFVRQHTPSLTFKLADFYPLPARKELLDPAAHLPQSTAYDYREISALYRYARSCAKVELSHAKSRSPLFKAWEWHRFACHAVSDLRQDFFEHPPLLHPSGSSYAFLAYKLGMPAQPALMHVAELDQLESVTLAPAQSILAQLDREAQAALLESAPLALSSRIVLLRTGATLHGEESSEYGVFDLREVERFFSARPVTLRRADPLKGCLLREGNGCWEFNSDRVYQRARLPSLILLAVTLFLTGLLGWVVLRRIREQRLEEQRKRFALQALTHELRTPIASLRVSAEILRDGFDRLAPAQQDAFLRVCDDLQRLQKVAEASRGYLRALEPGRLIALDPVPIPSLRDLLQSVVEAFGPRVVLEILETRETESDLALKQDGYWLGVCVRNLVENAVTHGKPPVLVQCSLEGQTLKICVSDQGTFSETSSRPGLGLGLSLIRRIASEMRGQLEMRAHPTTFTLRIPKDLS